MKIKTRLIIMMLFSITALAVTEYLTEVGTIKMINRMFIALATLILLLIMCLVGKDETETNE